jgi:hypothetical protein
VTWKHWVAAATPVPTSETPAYASVIGVFEGAAYNPTGRYRPKQNCRMRENGMPFCEVCSEAMGSASGSAGATPRPPGTKPFPWVTLKLPAGAGPSSAWNRTAAARRRGISASDQKALPTVRIREVSSSPGFPASSGMRVSITVPPTWTLWRMRSRVPAASRSRSRSG